ncbi:MAG: helix-turn-helix transcriptional regulator [Jatrophihabitantaceae bacterium]
MDIDGIREAAAKAPVIGVGSIGDFIREQRTQAQVSLRQLSRLAGVSNPYLSQVERGLRKPSAEILQQIAKGLRISAEQLYIRAGILENRPSDSELVSAILADNQLSERQKNVLIEIYESFRRENRPAEASAGSAAPSIRHEATTAATAATLAAAAAEPKE